MCRKCDEIDAQIERLRNLGHRMHDPQTLKGIAELIAELEAKRRALHPEAPPST